MSDTNAREIVERVKTNGRRTREATSGVHVQDVMAKLRKGSRRSPGGSRPDAVAQLLKGGFVGRR